MLSDLLHQLLLGVLGVKLGQEVEGDRLFLRNIVVQHLRDRRAKDKTGYVGPSSPHAPSEHLLQGA